MAERIVEQTETLVDEMLNGMSKDKVTLRGFEGYFLSPHSLDSKRIHLLVRKEGREIEVRDLIEQHPTIGRYPTSQLARVKAVNDSLVAIEESELRRLLEIDLNGTHEEMITRVQGPTPADFAENERQLAELEAMNKDELARLRKIWHTNPPQPYATLFAKLTPDQESKDELRERIQNDPHFTAEERFVARHELFDRWRAVVIAESGEGFND